MNQEQAAQLAEPFPDSQIHQLPKKNKNTGQTVYLDYVGHAEVTERLNAVDPEWWWEPMALDTDGGPLVRLSGSVAELWIWLSVAGVRRPGVGTASATAYSGEVAKELISDALRNAAMRFGVALHLWKRGDSAPAQTFQQAAQVAEQPAGVAGAVAARASVVNNDGKGGTITEGQVKNLKRLQYYTPAKFDDSEFPLKSFEATGTEYDVSQRVVNQPDSMAFRDATLMISFLKGLAGEEDQRPAAQTSDIEPLPTDATFEGFDQEPF